MPRTFKIYRKKIVRNFKDYGIWLTLKKGTLYLLRSIYENRIYRIYRINLDQYKSVNMHDDHFTFKCLDKNDDDAILQIVDMEEWLQDELTPRLAAGSALCMVVMNGSTVAGFNLVAFEKAYIPLINKTIMLRKVVAWTEQITIRRAYRRKGLGTFLTHRVFEELKKRGIRKLYEATLLHNTASVNLAKKAGFKCVADIHYRKMFGAKKWTWGKYASQKCQAGHASGAVAEDVCCRSLTSPSRTT